MYLSRITPRQGAERSSAFWEAIGDSYRLHQQLWDLFSDHPDRRRDFLFRLEEGRVPKVYTLSQRPPHRDSPLWRVEVKPFRPVLRPGDRLRFALRVNPTVKKNGRRHDVVMEARRSLKENAKEGEQPAEMPARPVLAQEAGEGWLQARAERWGIEPESGVRVDGYRLHALPGKGPKARIATLDMEGFLTVRDPEAFRRHLERGFGPAKGFGCGLMLLARANRS
jgi:CRISPR system Cascade subunit CasE